MESKACTGLGNRACIAVGEKNGENDQNGGWVGQLVGF